MTANDAMTKQCIRSYADGGVSGDDLLVLQQSCVAFNAYIPLLSTSKYTAVRSSVFDKLEINHIGFTPAA